jgi:hypothetical protein
LEARASESALRLCPILTLTIGQEGPYDGAQTREDRAESATLTEHLVAAAGEPFDWATVFAAFLSASIGGVVVAVVSGHAKLDEQLRERMLSASDEFLTQLLQAQWELAHLLPFRYPQLFSDRKLRERSLSSYEDTIEEARRRVPQIRLLFHPNSRASAHALEAASAGSAAVEIAKNLFADFDLRNESDAVRTTEQVKGWRDDEHNLDFLSREEKEAYEEAGDDETERVQVLSKNLLSEAEAQTYLVLFGLYKSLRTEAEGFVGSAWEAIGRPRRRWQRAERLSELGRPERRWQFWHQ